MIKCCEINFKMLKVDDLVIYKVYNLNGKNNILLNSGARFNPRNELGNIKARLIEKYKSYL